MIYGSSPVSPGEPVDAYWHPLTPEHGFPSLLYKAQGAPPQPATQVDTDLLSLNIFLSGTTRPCKPCTARLTDLRPTKQKRRIP